MFVKWHAIAAVAVTVLSRIKIVSYSTCEVQRNDNEVGFVTENVLCTINISRGRQIGEVMYDCSDAPTISETALV